LKKHVALISQDDGRQELEKGQDLERLMDLSSHLDRVEQHGIKEI
jgi:hypothetical protein